jgi:hypothetical protein
VGKRSGKPGVNYAHEVREVDGTLVAMKRRVYSFDKDKPATSWVTGGRSNQLNYAPAN